MDSGDIVFYLVIAISVIGSIAKAFKKKPTEVPTESRKESTKDLMKRILEEIQEKDDYFPKNQTTEPKPATSSPIMDVLAQPRTAAFNKGKNVEAGYVVPEVRQRKEEFPSPDQDKKLDLVIEPEDPFLDSLDLSDDDELKKAVVYSEILRPKF
jgi:hypothetical protein